jgi:phosphate starvation-inducible PhoH-like protein
LTKRRNKSADYTQYQTQSFTKQKRNPYPDIKLVTEDYYQQQSQRRKVELIPKSLNQESYIDLLTDESKLIIFATGPAGTGKTMLAVMAAIQAHQQGNCSKIVITRPAVGVDDEQHGFLPGDINAKMAPWTRPIMDVFAEYYRQSDITRMLDESIIEVSPLAFMRGRNLKNAFIVCDEMQNATINQMKMVLTRLAENSKMVITGDLRQTDRQFADNNGLLDFINKTKKCNSDAIAVIQFEHRDIRRHPVVAEVLKIYGDE